MEESPRVSPEQEQILNHLREGMAKLRENKIGRAVMAGDKQIAHTVSVSNEQMPHKQIALIIFNDGIMATFDKPAATSLEKFNKELETNDDWIVKSDLGVADFRETLAHPNTNDKGMFINNRTDSKSPEQAQSVLNDWAIIKPEITRNLERRGQEAVRKRIGDSAKTVADDLRGMFPEVPKASNGTAVPATPLS